MNAAENATHTTAFVVCNDR